MRKTAASTKASSDPRPSTRVLTATVLTAWATVPPEALPRASPLSATVAIRRSTLCRRPPRHRTALPPHRTARFLVGPFRLVVGPSRFTEFVRISP
ncbi:hypothetical protein IOD13_04115 [Brevibacterium casei]|nr:hypothetical protein [Brevibacterium casei]